MITTEVSYLIKEDNNDLPIHSIVSSIKIPHDDNIDWDGIYKEIKSLEDNPLFVRWYNKSDEIIVDRIKSFYERKLKLHEILDLG